MNQSRVIVALDFPEADQAIAFSKKLNPESCKLKIGKELFTHYGPDIIEQFRLDGFDIFLDLKFHDIPNTVASACKVAADLGVWMINVHALGGREMLFAASKAIEKLNLRPLLVAVTVLTSMSDDDFKELGVDLPISEIVTKLAKISAEAGLDGVVCSAQEAGMLRKSMGKEFCLVTPGIRPAGSESHDQSRVLSPKDAILAGSDYLVIGRPITRSNDPSRILKEIELEVNEALLLRDSEHETPK